MPKHVFEKEFYGKKFVIETGEIAKQADGAVLVRYNDTVILSTACASDEAKDTDFFPLTVSYEEKLYAVGKIPGSFLKREGRPSEYAILSARLIDRPIRPLFAEGFRNEVQVVNTVLSVDKDASSVMAAMLGSSLALCISDIPFDGPIAGVTVGRVNGQFVINPTVEEMENSDIDLKVAGTKKAINMVEAGAKVVSEEDMLEAIMFGHEAIKELIAFEEEIIKAVGKEKREVELFEVPTSLKEHIESIAKDRLVEAVRIKEKLERYGTIDAIKEEVLTPYEESKDYEDDKEKRLVIKQVKQVLDDIVKDEFRRLVTVDKIRPDGRQIDEIRPLDAQIDLLPRVHGSAMFTRGETQVISACTLAPANEYQIIDNTTDDEEKHFMHHYNFPPFSVGEVGRMGNPGRREIGHGALGERALAQVVPSYEDFPYTIRVVSEVVESNGSSSQASICASTMALMAAGVPISAPVAGIAMGLITNGPLEENAPYTVLTDIQGMEDHLGDMDFKVAGTREGVTALQMDIKISGINREILAIALKQAHKARMEILDLIESTIKEPRKEVSKYAPKIKKLVIDVEKIRDVIGQGGKTINDIIAKCDNVKIDIEQDGSVMIYHSEYEPLEKAANMILDIVREAKIGDIFEGKVTRVEPYGVFVSLFGSVEGLCHVSKLAHERVEHPKDLFKVGDLIKVVVTGIDEKGKVSLSRKDLLPKPKKEEVKKEEKVSE
ncbi:MAG: polyribonucleotide nucleotidyltransferase [Bacilli bacterium]|nr:polyribonucleotide nucleotidyltransferase [Bacilli bacterium]